MCGNIEGCRFSVRSLDGNALFYLRRKIMNNSSNTENDLKQRALNSLKDYCNNLGPENLKIRHGKKFLNLIENLSDLTTDDIIIDDFPRADICVMQCRFKAKFHRYDSVFYKDLDRDLPSPPIAFPSQNNTARAASFEKSLEITRRKLKEIENRLYFTQSKCTDEYDNEFARVNFVYGSNYLFDYVNLHFITRQMIECSLENLCYNEAKKYVDSNEMPEKLYLLNYSTQELISDFAIPVNCIYLKYDDNGATKELFIGYYLNLDNPLATDEEKDFLNIYPAYLSSAKKGCYIATCVYGSYDCPEVWTLRRYRDFTLGRSVFGRVFIKFYYAISPTVVKLFGKTKFFNLIWKKRLDKKVARLNAKGVDNTPYND